jgi:hypothetical protein
MRYPRGQWFPTFAPAVFRDVWRMYLLLVLANELDLTFTYVGLATGTFVEANPLMAPLLYTSWPFIMKHIALAGLGLAIVAVALVRPGLRRRLQQALSLAATVYAGVLLAHALNALARILPV